MPRDKLLQAALSAFAEQGFAGMSVRTLAQQLGVSHGLMNLRFGTKQQLWDACVEYGLDQFRARMLSLPHEGSLEVRFRAAVIQVLDAIHSVPEMLRLLNNEGTTASQRLDLIAETIVSERYSRLEEVIAEGIREGVLHDVPPQLTTLLVAHGGGVLFGLRPLALKIGVLSGECADETDVRARQIADLLWRGLLRHPVPAEPGLPAISGGGQ